MGDEVLLSTKNLLVRVAAGGSRKLGPLSCGPFTILAKLTSAYKLDLPPHMRVHPIFHVSQLKLYRRPEDTMRRYEKPDPVIIAVGEEEFEVEEIINHHKQRRGKTTKIEYLIFWKGYLFGYPCNHRMFPQIRYEIPLQVTRNYILPSFREALPSTRP